MVFLFLYLVRRSSHAVTFSTGRGGGPGWFLGSHVHSRAICRGPCGTLVLAAPAFPLTPPSPRFAVCIPDSSPHVCPTPATPPPVIPAEYPFTGTVSCFERARGRASPFTPAHSQEAGRGRMKGSNLYVWLCRQAKGLHWCKEIQPFQNDFYKKKKKSHFQIEKI